MYHKIGKFDNSNRFSDSDSAFGDQIKGFGFMHDGHMDTLDSFLQGKVFQFDSNAEANDQKRRQVVEFIMAFDSDLAPIVGQQVTLSASTGADTDARLDLLLERGNETIHETYRTQGLPDQRNPPVFIDSVR